MPIVDGKQIATEIFEEVAKIVDTRGLSPRMAIITCAPNFETRKYLELKKRKAEEVGIALTIIEMPEDAKTEDIICSVVSIKGQVNGIVVQLPLPPTVDREAVLDSIPPELDPDCFTGGETMGLLPPVVGAIDEISKRQNLSWKDKNVVVFGHGRLVGMPAALYAKKRGAKVIVLTKDSSEVTTSLEKADIIIAGAGQPHMITSDMVSEGVAIFDASTSEDGGELRGDVHPLVADKSVLFTPVPGGIGPITIAVLLRNLVNLVRQ